MMSDVTWTEATLPSRSRVKVNGYCVHGRCSEHNVTTGTVCIGPFTRSANDPSIIESERPGKRGK